ALPFSNRLIAISALLTAAATMSCTFTPSAAKGSALARVRIQAWPWLPAGQRRRAMGTTFMPIQPTETASGLLDMVDFGGNICRNGHDGRFQSASLSGSLQPEPIVKMMQQQKETFHEPDTDRPSLAGPHVQQPRSGDRPHGLSAAMGQGLGRGP